MIDMPQLGVNHRKSSSLIRKQKTVLKRQGDEGANLRLLDELLSGINLLREQLWRDTSQRFRDWNSPTDARHNERLLKLS